MNEQQRLYLVQARSDWQIFQLLDSRTDPLCHRLHYLQMVTEKVAKAYFWRDSSAANLGHAAFGRFLRAIATNRRVADELGFRNGVGFREWIDDISGLAHELERLAPALAADGPNPEYPWPRIAPDHTPVEHDFAFWPRFRSRDGFNLRRMLDLVLERFDAWF